MMEKMHIQQLFRQNYGKMMRVARSILFDEEECKDVVSDIFANLLHGNNVLSAQTEEYYLMTSVRNQCLKRLRHEEVKRRMAANATSLQTSDDESDDERLSEIDEFVERHLKEQERRIFQLRFSKGFSYEEIAAEEGISRVAVWKHLSHALNQIRNHFKK
jgi:RNA polymerase sigma-70 factor (ECF subfamily)